MDREKLHQYTLNQISDLKDMDEIINWIDTSSENKKEYTRLKNLWAYSEFANFEELSSSGRTKHSKAKLISMQFMRYAAVFILAFLIGTSTFYFLQSPQADYTAMNEVIVPLGESAEVVLPDQTRVWLNSGTQLKYPANFNGKYRDVELIGEAFFDVKDNPRHPFHVNTPNLTVEVLGTSFNVEAIPGLDKVNVTLVEGKVNLQNSKGEKLTELKPNQNGTYNLKNKQFKIEDVNVEFYTSWTKGILNFRHEKLYEIAIKLERCYNVKIEFDDPIVKELVFSGTILRNKPIDQILDILKFTSEIDYSIKIRNDKPNIIHLKTKPM